jgi:hypothetical protein
VPIDQGVHAWDWREKGRGSLVVWEVTSHITATAYQ